MHLSRRLLVCLALALMVVVLGAVAKHGQFENPAHQTHYLSKSVKMVHGDEPVPALCAFGPFVVENISAPVHSPVASAHLKRPLGSPVSAPLLV